MATAVKRCRVCGKEYEACRSANRAAGVFRWQEVACSPECGSIYLQQINESRGIVDARKKNKHGFNLNFFRLVHGDNNIKVTGDGVLTISGRFLYNVAG